jgi:hypothetical protein
VGGGVVAKAMRRRKREKEGKKGKKERRKKEARSLVLSSSFSGPFSFLLQSSPVKFHTAACS